jgi:hypothetical protein
MKRLLATLTLILCLSFSALAGHTQLGGRYCPCDNPESCSGLNVRANDSTLQDDGTQQNVPDVAVALLLLMIRLKLRA